MSTQRFFDPKKKTRITVTTPQQRSKRKKMQKQYARNRMQELMLAQMNLVAQITKTQQKANRNYLTTPVDKWSEIDRAKNELIAMGKGYDETIKGIGALNRDLELINAGLSDSMNNWNDFMSGVSQVVKGSVSVPTQTEIDDIGLNPITFGTPIPVGPIIQTEGRMTKKQVLEVFGSMGISDAANSTAYKTYFTKAGQRRSDYINTPYRTIFENIRAELALG